MAFGFQGTLELFHGDVGLGQVVSASSMDSRESDTLLVDFLAHAHQFLGTCTCFSIWVYWRWPATRACWSSEILVLMLRVGREFLQTAGQQFDRAFNLLGRGSWLAATGQAGELAFQTGDQEFLIGFVDLDAGSVGIGEGGSRRIRTSPFFDHGTQADVDGAMMESCNGAMMMFFSEETIFPEVTMTLSVSAKQAHMNRKAEARGWNVIRAWLREATA